MRKVCIYGKGGIGKSTVVANAAAAAAKAGNRVMVVGCDPKADTTRVLMHGRIETILDVHARLGGRLTRADAAHEGAFGVLCMESGGPRAGEGCADEMLHGAETTVPEPLSTEALEAIGERIAAQFAQSEEGFAR